MNGAGAKGSPRRAMVRILPAVLIGVVALAACRVVSEAPSIAPTSAPSPTPAASTDVVLPATDPVVGVVTHVDSTGLDSVTGFTLRATDGQVYQFDLGRLQNAAAFPPGHLVEHAASSEPIKVTFLASGSTIFAIRLEDANPPATSTPPATNSPPTGAPPTAAPATRAPPTRAPPTRAPATSAPPAASATPGAS